jgi:glycerol-3-phosphate O-acyltransferase
VTRQVSPEPSVSLETEFGPILRRLCAPYFEPVRFTTGADTELAALSAKGLVIHVMRTTSWINYLYLAWTLVKRGLPPIRAVVNLRRWFTRPWRKAAQRGDFEARFTFARRRRGAGLIFLKSSFLGSAQGRDFKEDPFPALVAMARKSPVPIYLVPELFVWEKAAQRLQPSVLDYIFGSPEAPGFVYTMIAFRRNYKRAQFRVGEPIDLQRFVTENEARPDALVARKVRSTLYQHLARETRAVFGPPRKDPGRIIEQTLRDRTLRKALEEQAAETDRPLAQVEREAKRNLKSIAARFEPTVVAMAIPILNWVFNRIYAGIEVDDAGLDRSMKAAARAPVVFCPSHKSHIDYLVMSFVLWKRGYSVPLVAAGANLSFFPLGPFFRRVGAFFLRRSFKGDVVYTAVFKAYLKKLVREGVHQEFFPEGGRSRTGKLLTPKLGMLSWEVEAVLEGARDDLNFVPVSIDYEKVPESKSYSKELAGYEKRPEDFKALLSVWKVLRSRFGRIHLAFDEPISLAKFMGARGLSLNGPISDPAKRSLIRALAHRIMYGIDRVSTVTPQALASAALLAQRGRGVAVSEAELNERVELLRQIAADQGRSISAAPVDEAVEGFADEGLVRRQEARGQMMYLPLEERRYELAFYKNALMNWVVPESLVANGLLVEGESANRDRVRDNAQFLSRLFKFEFVYQVGLGFDALFSAAVENLVRREVLLHQGSALYVLPSQTRARPKLVFLADLLRDYLESYLAATLTLEDLTTRGSMSRKAFIDASTDTGRAEFLAGRLDAPESLSRLNFENAVLFFLDRGILVESDKGLSLADPGSARNVISSLSKRISYHLSFPATPTAVRRQAV